MKRLVIVAVIIASGPVLGQSAAQLGRPVVTRAAEPDPFLDGPPPPAAKLGVVSAAQVGTGPRDASNDEMYNWGVPRTRPASRSREIDDRDDRDVRPSARLREPVRGRTTALEQPAPGEKMGEWFDERGREIEGALPAPFGSAPRRDPDRDRFTLASDCAFDDFISPSSNPFLAEDPRSLTELRPLFLYQTIPGDQAAYRGGSAYFFGLQGRLAFTDRLSVVLHKLGGVSFSPGDGATAQGATGMAEIWLGPKFVFWRDVENQRLGSFGMIFQMPVGSGGWAFQGTGKLTLVPYFSHARNLGKTPLGRFNLINTVGYAIGTSSERSDYLFDTLHVDLDVADNHRFYPFIEMSWFHYTSDGSARPGLGFEGRDLANVGAAVGGRDFLSIAPGMRYKFSESLQFGVTAELPLLGTKDLHQFRLGVDMIWRY